VRSSVGHAVASQLQLKLTGTLKSACWVESNRHTPASWLQAALRGWSMAASLDLRAAVGVVAAPAVLALAAEAATLPDCATGAAEMPGVAPAAAAAVLLAGAMPKREGALPPPGTPAAAAAAAAAARCLLLLRLE
jgi:hypothetical protein